MKKALTTSDTDTQIVRMSAHRLKSAALNLGATQLARYCSGLERRYREGTFLEVGELVKAIECEFEAVKGALKREVETLC